MDKNIRDIYINLMDTSGVHSPIDLINNWFEFKRDVTAFNSSVSNLAIKTPAYVVMLNKYRVKS